LIHPSSITVKDSLTTDPCRHAVIPTRPDATFSVVLPEHHRYTIRAEAPQYIAAEQRLGVRELDSISPLHLNILLFDARRPLASLYFDRGSFVISDSSRHALQELAEKYAHRAVNFSVAGYTDMLGSVPFNRALSEQRAESVAAELSRYGIDPRRVRARGKGIEVMGFPTSGRENPLSRRVDIFPADQSN
jgi:outer membrane protein OmpA-like peptidoglycan-associated protein